MVIYHDFKPLMVIYHDFNPWPLRDIWDFKPLTMDYGPINQYWFVYNYGTNMGL